MSMHQKNTSDLQENNHKSSSNRLAQAALIFSLLTTPVIENTNGLSAQDSAINKSQTECMQSAKTVNTMTQEQVIKKSVKESFSGVKSLKELPRKMIYA
jgi:hypothetical protein